ncbi:unnamed protein product [Pleuronectes platessa]|uniref:Uncharacterized protein n=1 Tax=Pleuronectes platessa TaxID=8262 RepID=A0A9N7U922_PLEPL|nr:unnamed protein product [Pleuronectes platessa]
MKSRRGGERRSEEQGELLGPPSGGEEDRRRAVGAVGAAGLCGVSAWLHHPASGLYLRLWRFTEASSAGAGTQGRRRRLALTSGRRRRGGDRQRGGGRCSSTVHPGISRYSSFIYRAARSTVLCGCAPSRR